MINLDDVPAAVSEVREAKKLGAVAVMVLGTARSNLLDHPTLFPFFEAVADEGLALHRSRLHPKLGDNVVDYERNEIQYWQEDPSIRKMFEEKLAESGLSSQTLPECYKGKTFDPNWGRQGKTEGQKKEPYASDFASRTSDYLKEREIT